MDGRSSEQYRQALGLFATGVAIVTTVGSAGEPIGMTVSSFSSVSLDPPLVLWSVGQQAPEYEAFCQCRYYAIHFLAGKQQELSNRFATPGADKFAALETSEMIAAGQNTGVPVLSRSLACLQCEIEQNHLAGDHNILVGRVLSFSVPDSAESGGGEPPLLYFGGTYREIAEL
ncbi:hypothetical protein AB833_24770 [Chromatiales bacterium (ex Bugula neritina AB1)]|nr:hypothetical protein AB833_24770 [Chromatiales bacterium (ex Bugula neritina AB1)]